MSPAPGAVLLAAGLVLALTASALAMAGLARIRARRRAKIEALVARQWAPMFNRAAASFSVDLTPVSRRYRRALLLLWCHYQESLGAEAHGHLNVLARRLGLDTEARRLARTRRLPDRMLGVTALGHLAEPDLWDELAASALTGGPQWEPAARALVRIDAAKAVRLLGPAFGGAIAVHPARAMAALSGAPSEEVGAALGELLLATADAPAQARLLRLIAASRSPHAAGPVRLLLAVSADPEVLAGCAHVLGLLRDRSCAAEVVSLAGHDEWFVRLNAAVALGRAGRAEDEGVLLGLLNDPEWLVRRAAAEALAAGSFPLSPVLEAMAAVHPDAGARAVLALAIAEQAAC